MWNVSNGILIAAQPCCKQRACYGKCTQHASSRCCVPRATYGFAEQDPYRRALPERAIPPNAHGNRAHHPQSPLNRSASSLEDEKSQRPKRQRRHPTLPNSKDHGSSADHHESPSPGPNHADSEPYAPRDYYCTNTSCGAAHSGTMGEAQLQLARPKRRPQRRAVLASALSPDASLSFSEERVVGPTPPLQMPPQPPHQQPHQQPQPPVRSVMTGWGLAGEMPQRNAVYRLIRKTELQQQYQHRNHPLPTPPPPTHQPTATAISAPDTGRASPDLLATPIAYATPTAPSGARSPSKSSLAATVATNITPITTATPNTKTASSSTTSQATRRQERHTIVATPQQHRTDTQFKHDELMKPAPTRLGPADEVLFPRQLQPQRGFRKNGSKSRFQNGSRRSGPVAVGSPGGFHQAVQDPLPGSGTGSGTGIRVGWGGAVDRQDQVEGPGGDDGEMVGPLAYGRYEMFQTGHPAVDRVVRIRQIEMRRRRRQLGQEQGQGQDREWPMQLDASSAGDDSGVATGGDWGSNAGIIQVTLAETADASGPFEDVPFGREDVPATAACMGLCGDEGARAFEDAISATGSSSISSATEGISSLTSSSSSSLLKEALMSDLALMNPVYRMIRKHEIRQRRQPPNGPSPASPGPTAAGATDPWGDDAFADVMLGGLTLPPPLAVHSPVTAPSTMRTTSAYGSQAADAPRVSDAVESHDRGPEVAGKSGNSRRRLALHRASSVPPITLTNEGNDDDNDDDGGEDDVTTTATAQCGGLTSRPAAAADDDNDHAASTASALHGDQDSVQDDSGDDRALEQPDREHYTQQQRSGFGLNPVLRLIRKKQLQQRLRKRGRLDAGGDDSSTSGRDAADCRDWRQSVSCEEVGPEEGGEWAIGPEDAVGGRAVMNPVYRLIRKKLLLSRRAHRASVPPPPPSSPPGAASPHATSTTIPQAAGSSTALTPLQSTLAARAPFFDLDLPLALRDLPAPSMGPAPARDSLSDPLTAAPAPAPASAPASPSPPSVQRQSRHNRSSQHTPQHAHHTQHASQQWPQGHLSSGTEPGAAGGGDGVSWVGGDHDDGGVAAAASAAAAAGARSSGDVGMESEESRFKAVTPMFPEALPSGDNLHPGSQDGRAAAGGTLDAGEKGLAEAGPGPPPLAPPAPTQTPPAPTSPLSSMPTLQLSPPLVSDRLAERLVGERSHMNQVYRLIRKKELQLRRLQSAAAAAAAAAASPPELRMLMGMVRHAPAAEPPYGRDVRQRTSVGPMGWTDPPALLHPFELEDEKEMGGQLSAPSAYGVGTSAAATLPAPSSLHSYSRLFLDSTYDDEYEDGYDIEGASAGTSGFVSYDEVNESILAADDEGTFASLPAAYDVDDEDVANNDASEDSGGRRGLIGSTTERPRVTHTTTETARKDAIMMEGANFNLADDGNGDGGAGVEDEALSIGASRAPTSRTRQRRRQPPIAVVALSGTGAISDAGMEAVAPTGKVPERKMQAGGAGAGALDKPRRGRPRKDCIRGPNAIVTPRRQRIQELKASLRAKLLLQAAPDTAAAPTTTGSFSSPSSTAPSPSQLPTRAPATASDRTYGNGAVDPHHTIGGVDLLDNKNLHDSNIHSQSGNQDASGHADGSTSAVQHQHHDIQSTSPSLLTMAEVEEVNLAGKTEPANQVRRPPLPPSPQQQQQPQLARTDARLQASTAHPLSWQVARRNAAAAAAATTTVAAAAVASSAARGVKVRPVTSQSHRHMDARFGLLGFLRDTNYTDADAGAGAGAVAGKRSSGKVTSGAPQRGRDGLSEKQRPSQSQPQRRPLRFSGIAQLWQSAGLSVGPPAVAPGQQLERRLAQVGVTAGVASRLAASAPVLTRRWDPGEVLTRLRNLQNLLTGTGAPGAPGAGNSSTGKGTMEGAARVAGGKGDGKAGGTAASGRSEAVGMAAAHTARPPSNTRTTTAATATAACAQRNVHRVGADVGRGRDDVAIGAATPPLPPPPPIQEAPTATVVITSPPAASSPTGQLSDMKENADMALAAVVVAKQPNLLTRQPAALEVNLAALAAVLGIDRHAAQALVRTWPSLLELRAASLPGRLAALASELRLGAGSVGSVTSVINSCDPAVGDGANTTTNTNNTAITYSKSSPDVRNDVVLLGRTTGQRVDAWVDERILEEPATVSASVSASEQNIVAQYSGGTAASALAAGIVRRYPPALALTQGAVGARVTALEQAIKYSAHTTPPSPQPPLLSSELPPSTTIADVANTASSAHPSPPWPRVRALQLFLAHPGLLGYSPKALGARWRSLMAAVSTAESAVQGGRQQQPTRAPSSTDPSAATFSSLFPDINTATASVAAIAATVPAAIASCAAVAADGGVDAGKTDNVNLSASRIASRTAGSVEDSEPVEAVGPTLPWRTQLLSGSPSAAARCLSASEARLLRLSYVASLVAAAAAADAAADDAERSIYLPDYSSAAVAAPAAASTLGQVVRAGDGQWVASSMGPSVDIGPLRKRGRPRKTVPEDQVSPQQSSPFASWWEVEGGSEIDAMPVERVPGPGSSSGPPVGDVMVSEHTGNGSAASSGFGGGCAADRLTGRRVEVVSISTTLSLTNEKFEKRYPGFEAWCRRKGAGG